MNRILGVLSVGSLLLLAACGGEAGGDATLSAADSVQVDGQPVRRYFAQNCSACHGTQREGRIGPALTPERLTQDAAFYADTIANGRSGTAMPAWGGGLTKEDITTLVTWLMTSQPGDN